MVNLWIDDLRLPPEGWLWAKTPAEALGYLATYDIEEVSFDHDLGGDLTTRPIVLHLSEFGGWPSVCRVHSQNNVGRNWLEGMINRYGPGVTY